MTQIVDIEKREIERAKQAVERAIFVLEENLVRENNMLAELYSIFPRQEKKTPRKRRTLQDAKKGIR